MCGCALLLLASCSYEVRPVRSSTTLSTPGGMLYALPRTNICVDFTVGHYDTTGAPFVKFAKDMLSFNRPLGLYEIRGVNITTQVDADPQAYYFVNPRGLNIQIDDRNLLRSIGVDALAGWDGTEPTEEEMQADIATHRVAFLPQYNIYERTDTIYARGDKPGHPTLITTKKDARTLRQRAMAAAERIAQLQERRKQLLNGEYDGSYAPETVKLLIEQINRQEHDLLEQFTGHYVTSVVRYAFAPETEHANGEEEQSRTLCYFSPTMGMVDSGAVRDAEPVYCRVVCHHSLSKVARHVKVKQMWFYAKKPADRNTFKYRRSEETEVEVTFMDKKQQKTVQVAQFGPTIELPYGKFKALFDAQTGEVIYFGK